jgi:hypothetical protein
MKWIFAIIFMNIVSLSYSSTPVQTQSQPIICPPRNSIIQQGLGPFMIQDTGGNWYGGFLSKNAGTIHLWTFMFGRIPAANSTTARNLLVLALPTIKAPEGPIHVNANQWQCTYPNLANYMAIAIYPPLGCEQCANPA